MFSGHAILKNNGYEVSGGVFFKMTSLKPGGMAKNTECTYCGFQSTLHTR